MEKQSVIFIVVALLAGFMLGLLVALSIDSSPLVNKDIEVKKSFINELREKGFLPPTPESIANVYGKVKEIKDNQLVVILENRFDDPLGEFLPETMTININEETEIFKIEEKASDVFEQEQKEFEKEMKKYGNEIPGELMPPEPFEKIDIKIYEIKQGDAIYAFSENDFKGKSEFTADTIQVEEIIEMEEGQEIPVE